MMFIQLVRRKAIRRRWLCLPLKVTDGLAASPSNTAVVALLAQPQLYTCRHYVSSALLEASDRFSLLRTLKGSGDYSCGAWAACLCTTLGREYGAVQVKVVAGPFLGLAIPLVGVLTWSAKSSKVRVNVAEITFSIMIARTLRFVSLFLLGGSFIDWQANLPSEGSEQLVQGTTSEWHGEHDKPDLSLLEATYNCGPCGQPLAFPDHSFAPVGRKFQIPTTCTRQNFPWMVASPGVSCQLQTDVGLSAAFELAFAEFIASTSNTTDRTLVSARTEACLVPQFLSALEVEECLQVAAMCEQRTQDEGAWARNVDEEGELMPDGITLCETLAGVAHDMVFSDRHVALFLHRDGHFQKTCPRLFHKLFHGMCSQSGMCEEAASLLKVRCIELHTYAAGGGLLSPGHRDQGSILTMAVLISDEQAMEGGQFVTYRDGLPIFHSMAKGDAIVFHSEQLHNIATVLRGTRCSLVLELWKGSTNTKNRFF